MEPPAKREKVENDEKETTGWFDIPFELRIIIIEIMPDTTIYKFAQCSKLCYEEAISSKNYCHHMRIVEEKRRNSYEIQFYKLWPLWTFEFHDNFQAETIVKYRRDKSFSFEPGKILWRVTETGKLFDVIAKYANEYIQKFGKNLKNFEMSLGCKGRSNLIRSIQLRNMRKLEELTIHPTSRQVCLIKHKFVDFDQIKRVKSYLHLPATVLSFDQLIQLKAKHIVIYMMDLTPKDINQYIKYWRDGKLNANVKSVSIHGGFSEKNKKRKDVEVDLEGLDFEIPQKYDYDNKYIMNYDKSEKARFTFHKMRFNMDIEDV
ncbi:unnamed protein product [Caenorhabditis angaria]|uniref:Sdz-33 F-box domain-containing protein n=1 Tax=Caenorhabditis angaria TaxID=860376 RepID=A0A9P1N6N6_9PELO|nr:unnamed protein product [Caenorhabditis angaria]